MSNHSSAPINPARAAYRVCICWRANPVPLTSCDTVFAENTALAVPTMMIIKTMKSAAPSCFEDASSEVPPRHVHDRDLDVHVAHARGALLRVVHLEARPRVGDRGVSMAGSSTGLRIPSSMMTERTCSGLR